MKDKVFETALWGRSWEDVLSETDTNYGEASLTDGEGVRLSIPFGEILSDDMFGKKESVDCLFGFSRDGEYLVLKNAISLGSTESYPGGKKQKLGASCILSSRERFDVNKNVQSVALELQGLREWLGEVPITAKHYENRKKLSIEMDLETKPSIMLSQGDFEISIGHSILTSPLTSAGIKMSHDCYLNIKCSIPCSIDSFINNVLYPMQKFFSFCVGKYVSIVDLKFQLADSQKSINYYASFLPSKGSISDTDYMPLPYSVIKNNLSDLFSLWMSFKGDLERGTSLLVSLLTIEWKMPLDLVFISAAQLFEAFARHNQKTNDLSETQFTKYLRVTNESIDNEEIRKWVEEKLKNSNHLSQRKLLKSLLRKLGQFTKYIVPDSMRFLENHLQLRNAYTHRSKDCESSKLLKDADLYWHTQGVLFLSYGAVLFYLGYSPEEIIDVFSKSYYQWYQVSKVQDLYSKVARSTM